MSTKKLTNEEFQERLNDIRNEGKDIYTDYEYINMTTPLDFYCSKGHFWNSKPKDVLHDHSGCPVCANKKVIIGYNDMWTTAPHVACLLRDKMDGYIYTYMSNKSVDFICPYCGAIINKPIQKVTTRGLSCHVCGDNISYPNKFSRSLLKQLPVQNIDYEWSPEWLRPYKYDNYFEYNGMCYVLEMDGRMGHGNNDKTEKHRNSGLFGEELDSYKDSLSIKHNVHVIRVDCAYRDTVNRDKYIIDKLMHSEIGTLFNLSNIDWDRCNHDALTSMVYQVSILFDSGLTVRQISDKIGYSRTTVKDWLKQGQKVHINTYTTEISKQRGQLMRTDKRRSKKVVQYTQDGQYIQEYPSATVAGKDTGFSSRMILYHCQKQDVIGHLYKGYLWYFVNDNLNKNY